MKIYVLVVSISKLSLLIILFYHYYQVVQKTKCIDLAFLVLICILLYLLISYYAHALQIELHSNQITRTVTLYWLVSARN